jgi:hypothetical protein
MNTFSSFDPIPIMEHSSNMSLQITQIVWRDVDTVEDVTMETDLTLKTDWMSSTS